MSEPRNRSEIDQLADAHFDRLVELSPNLATYLGKPQGQDRYDDFSPEGLAAVNELNRATLDQASRLKVTDEVDRATLAVLRERLGLQIEAHEARADLLSLNGITSGLHDIREVHDLMPQESDDDWAAIAKRLHAVPEAIDGWFASQQAAIEAGLPPAARQVELLIEQVRGWVGEGGFFASLSEAAGERSEALTKDLELGTLIAEQAFDAAADRLAREIGPRSTEVDAVGRERYQLASRAFLGAKIDLNETYQWGLEEVARVEAEMRETAERIAPGASIRGAQDALDADPNYRLEGTAELQAWMQERADEAVAAMVRGGHFAIPEPLRRIECRIADTSDGGIYYTSPSEDFSRPGRMWWSVPEGLTTFGTWRELTTVYHEGVPGHHLQHAIALSNPDLNQWRRHCIWVPGHGEGWALYAERLMRELGFQDDPGNLMGLLDSQALRAVRVVIDIGVHCGLPAPDEVGGGEWTFDKAWDYFNSYVSMSEGNARFEVLRYFGWPGQAPSYRLGERHWLELREEVRRREGAGFDLARFHQRALEVGSMGLDTLREVVLDAAPSH